MSLSAKTFLIFLFRLLPFFAVGTVYAAQGGGPGFPDAPGRDVFLGKCFQCHADGMWRDHRQDRRGWEATLYRMVGRGALWTDDEIKSMADYLGVAFGPQTARAADKTPKQQ